MSRSGHTYARTHTIGKKTIDREIGIALISDVRYNDDYNDIDLRTLSIFRNIILKVVQVRTGTTGKNIVN